MLADHRIIWVFLHYAATGAYLFPMRLYVGWAGWTPARAKREWPGNSPLHSAAEGTRQTVLSRRHSQGSPTKVIVPHQGVNKQRLEIDARTRAIRVVMHSNADSENVVSFVVATHIGFRRKPLVEIARDGRFPAVRILA